MIESRIFFYAGIDAANGLWIDGDDIESMGEVYEVLEEAGIIPANYGGDVLAADAEGLAKGFLGNYGFFDLTKFVEFRDADGDDDAKLAFVSWIDSGECEVSVFQDTYVTKVESREDFAQHWMDEIHGDIIRQAEQSGLHIDWEGTARELFIQDFAYIEGHVFRNL